MRRRLPALLASPYLRAALGLVISGFTLYLALRKVNLSEVWAALLQADVRFVGIALFSVAVNTLAKTFRWQVLLGEAGRKISLYKLLQALLAGQMLNNVYPGRLGDLSRAYVIGGLGPGRVFTLGTVLLEKMLDMLSYSLLFILLILLIPLPAWVNDSVYTITLVVLLASAAVFLLAFRPGGFLRILDWIFSKLPVKISSYLGGRVLSGVASLEVLHTRSALFWMAFWSAVSWSTAVLNNYLVFQALRLVLPWTASLLVLVLLQAGITVPSAPVKIGVFEVICVLALAIYGVAQAPALSYGILLHAIVLIPTTLLGLVFFALLGMGGKQIEGAFELRERAGG